MAGCSAGNTLNSLLISLYITALIFSRCSLHAAFQKEELNLPQPKALPGQTELTPYVVVADDAFALGKHLMKPFPHRNMDAHQRIYNYRLSRARRVVENAFGICAARFRILRRPIDLSPEKVTTIVMAICALHNFLSRANLIVGDVDRAGIVTPGSWRKDPFNFPSMAFQTSGRNNYAQSLRLRFMQYFNSESGAVSWQNNIF